MLNSIGKWLKSNPIVILILLALLVFAVLWFKDAIGGQIERFNQWRFAKAVAAKQAENDKLSETNKRLMDEIKKSYAYGEAKELERDAAYAELERYGAAARAAVEKQKEAAKQYEAEKAAIDVDATLHQRCLNLCTERAELGYSCKPSADIYCSRYAGR